MKTVNFNHYEPFYQAVSDFLGITEEPYIGRWNHDMLINYTPGRSLRLLILYKDSECRVNDTDAIHLLHQMVSGELYDTICPDNDNIAYQFHFGNSFHGMEGLPISGEISRLLKRARWANRHQDEADIYFIYFEITDYAS